MEIGTIIKTLQDPMGIPFYPVVFQILMVLTFALHIMFVNFTVGTSALALYGHLKKINIGQDCQKQWQKRFLPMYQWRCF